MKELTLNEMEYISGGFNLFGAASGFASFVANWETFVTAGKENWGSFVNTAGNSWNTFVNNAASDWNTFLTKASA